MQRLLLCGLLFPAALIAAPVPKDFADAAKRQEKLFGKTTVPPAARGGEFRFDAKGVTAKMPAARFGDECEPGSGMRTAALVTGNFEAEVTMRLGVAPVPQVSNKNIFLGGGLLAHSTEPKTGGFVSVSQHVAGRQFRPNRPHGWRREVITLFNGGGDTSDEEFGPDPGEWYHLRMTRAGNTFALSVSADGKVWTNLRPQKVELPEAVSVGVFCYNRTGEPVDATFERLSIRPVK